MNRESQPIATPKNKLGPDDLAAAKAMLATHFAVAKRESFFFARPRVEPPWALDMEFVRSLLRQIGWSEQAWNDLARRCAQIEATDVRHHVHRLTGGVPRVPGVSESAMLIHYDVLAKLDRLHSGIRPRSWRILQLKLTPVVRPSAEGKVIAFRSWRSVANAMGVRQSNEPRRRFKIAMVRAAEILVLNSN